jgi:hypothetical protein
MEVFENKISSLASQMNMLKRKRGDISFIDDCDMIAVLVMQGLS